MYLTRLFLDPRSRAARRDLTDSHQLHRTVMGAFPDLAGGRAEACVLHRLESEHAYPVLYVQSAIRPDWTSLPERYLHDDWMGEPNPAVRELDAVWAGLSVGQELRFRLLANPVKRLRVESEGASGPRVPIIAQDQLTAWLARKAEDGGFELLSTTEVPSVPSVEATPAGERGGWRVRGEKRHRLTFAGVRFDGRLRIVDVEEFRRSLREGIGPAKAYGYGLLSIAP